MSRNLERRRSRAWRWTRRLIVYPMIGFIVAVIVGLTFIATTRYSPGPPQEGDLALTGATVLAGSDLQQIDGATVLIRDGIIAEVGPADEIDIPIDAEVVDLSGTTLMPGLIDLHVHLGMPELDAGETFGWRTMPATILDAMRHAPGARRSLLEHGVTTVRSLGDDHTWVMELRRLVAEGELEGPRVVAAGPVFTTPGGHPVVTIHGGRVIEPLGVPASPEEAREAVRHLSKADGGVDLIKVVQDRGSSARSLQPIAPDVLEAIVDEAHSRGLPVVAHWGTLDDLDDVLAAGVDGLEHLDSRDLLDGWPEDRLLTIIERELALTPTLAVTEAAFADRDPTIVARYQQRAAEFHDAGGRLVVGSDAAMPGVPYGGGVHRELQLLVGAGLSPHEALRAATSAAADELRTDQLGVIEPGRAADLLAVDGSPQHDISALDHVVAVWRDGRLVIDHVGSRPRTGSHRGVQPKPKTVPREPRAPAEVVSPRIGGFASRPRIS